MSPNDQGLTTFRECEALGTSLPCKRSDKAKCAAGQARIAQQSRSDASEP